MENKNKFQFLETKFEDSEVARKSLTYWQDAWRRLKSHRMAMVGLVLIVISLIFAFIGPYFLEMSYSDQINDYRNLRPKLDVHKLDTGSYLHVSKEYGVFEIDKNGKLIRRLEHIKRKNDLINKIYYYKWDEDTDLKLDFSYNLLPNKQGYDYNYAITLHGNEYMYIDKTIRNKLFPLGTDSLGRDMLARIMFGTRISLIVAFIATMANLFIGVIYGSIAGFEGGVVDTIMMRIVDIINSIPLTLYVILLMVWMPKAQGLSNIIIALSTVYWVSIARLVRGQMLSIKEQEFVLAAKTIGVPKRKIIAKHLIPNAMGPIIVSMAMLIPSAIFTEAFLSFIGIGVSAPMASLGTLANDALPALTTYPYQLIYPSVTIAIIILAFNFLGDGLRDALDPRLRKG